MIPLDVPDGPSLRRDVVVVGVDGSEPSTRALAWALDAAATRGWAVEAVTAWPEAGAVWVHDVPGHHSEPRHRAVTTQARTVEAATRAVATVPQLTSVIVNSHPVDALLQRSADARLLVVGSHGREGAPDRRHVPVDETLALLSPCPVVVFRAKDPTRSSPDNEAPASPATTSTR
jgi:nucleotide-binding universal stress UspA family protein